MKEMILRIVLDAMKKYAAETSTTLDDQLVALLERILSGDAGVGESLPQELKAIANDAQAELDKAA